MREKNITHLIAKHRTEDPPHSNTSSRRTLRGAGYPNVSHLHYIFQQDCTLFAEIF